MQEHSSQQLSVASTATRSHSPSDAPPENQEKPSDAKAHTAVLIGWILRGGVILSASITLIGMLLLPLRPGGLSDHRMLTFPHTLHQERVDLLTFHPQAVIVLGLLLLIATPVLSVAVSAAAFAREHDRPFVIISLIVLAFLITSFLIGKGGG